MSSITCRIATGAQAGRKVAALQTIPADADALEGDAGTIGGKRPPTAPSYVS